MGKIHPLYLALHIGPIFSAKPESWRACSLLHIDPDGGRLEWGHVQWHPLPGWGQLGHVVCHLLHCAHLVWKLYPATVFFCSVIPSLYRPERRWWGAGGGGRPGVGKMRGHRQCLLLLKETRVPPSRICMLILGRIQAIKRCNCLNLQYTNNAT